MAMSHMSHIVKINVFMICIFIIFKLVEIYISNINVFSQLNDIVYMSCGKQMNEIVL